MDEPRYGGAQPLAKRGTHAIVDIPTDYIINFGLTPGAPTPVDSTALCRGEYCGMKQHGCAGEVPINLRIGPGRANDQRRLSLHRALHHHRRQLLLARRPRK